MVLFLEVCRGQSWTIPGLMHTSFLGRLCLMPSKYDPETRAKAVRLVLDHRGDYPSEWAAIKAVSSRLGMNAETLRNWIRQQQVDDGQRDGIGSEAAAEIRALKRRNAELEQTIEILKAATSFFVRESDPRSRR
jgi:transposase